MIDTPPLLDASALIAVADREHGWDAVPDPSTCLTTAINAAELVSHLVGKGGDARSMTTLVELMCPIVCVDGEIALKAGVLFARHRPLRISLADCVCLAYAERHGHTVIVADRRWSEIETEVPIVQFR